MYIYVIHTIYIYINIYIYNNIYIIIISPTKLNTTVHLYYLKSFAAADYLGTLLTCWRAKPKPFHPGPWVMHYSRFLLTCISPPAPIPAHEVATNGLWISKWVDYSNKYGLGYQLSDGSVGVLFNDGTKMVLAPDDV